jgi:predicted DCC family thiol-disulfide oxidoreductase YuxK
MSMSTWWHRTFLAERPSLSLGLFRVAVAVAVGCHMFPGFVQMEDNYLATAFKEKNGSFFPLWALQLIEQSPDWLVWTFVGLFGGSWACVLIGFNTQASCLLMGLSCYYFYALNALHIGTLSFDILLVTLSLMYVTRYPGDFLSVDSLLRDDPRPYKRLRPFFVQRLLQLQIAWTFFYTGLSKITAGGNWLTDNPYYYLMRYPPQGVVRQFPFRAWLAGQPAVCQWIEILVIAGEFTLPVLLFIRRTRPFALLWGFTFHVLLLITLHVPTIFFFLFPPQLLLFIEPEQLVAFIERRRARHAQRGNIRLLYDGRCGFCLASVQRLLTLDLFGRLMPIDFHGVADLRAIHPSLTREGCQSRMQCVEPYGRITEGFDAFRRISVRLVLLWPLVPLLYLPGVRWVGVHVYDWIAARRFLFHRGRLCADNQCALPH